MVAPKLRFKEFNDDWSLKKLGDVSFKPQYGMNSSATEFDGENKYLRITDINEDDNSFNFSKLTSPDDDLDDKYLLKNGDLLFARTGASVGKSYLYNSKDGKVYFAGFLIKFSLHTNVNPYFIFNQTLSKKFQNWVITNSMRSGQPGINAEEYSSLPITFTSLEEQTKIASFLSAVDEKISQLTQKHALLSQYKQGMMQKLFSQQIRFKADDGSEFGEWEETELGKHCQIKTGKLDANAMRPNGEFRFYTCAKEFYLIDEYAFDTEALLISGNGANVGYIHYYKGKFNAYQRTYVLDQWQQNIIFIQYFLEQFLKERIYGEKKEGNTPYIVLSTLSEMPLLLPCLAEQTKIANFLSAIDQKIEVVAQQIEQAKLWKKGLLQQMFV